MCKNKKASVDCQAQNCQNRVSCHLGEHDSSKSPTQQDTLPAVHHWNNSNIAESGVSRIINAYEEVILWRPNVLKLPKDEDSKIFIQLLASEYEKASSRDNTSKVPLITVTVMIQCILQRINTNEIATIRKTIQRRLDLWGNNMVYELLEETRHFEHERFNTLIAYEKIIGNDNA
ncbi:hypothetical protein GJ496_008071 [Pomphorhynchus laevis]|nr:hypothetical protein GJ496_008071 [Pomphorhynchus laevis]